MVEARRRRGSMRRGAADPLDANALCVIVGTALYRSHDGGQRWEAVALGQPKAPVVVDVAHASGSASAVVVLTGSATNVDGQLRSADDGKTWRFEGSDGLTGPVASIAHGANGDDLVVVTGAGAFRARGATVATATTTVSCNGPSVARQVPPLAATLLPVATGTSPLPPPNPPAQVAQILQAVGLAPAPEEELRLAPERSTQRPVDEDLSFAARRRGHSSDSFGATRLAGVVVLCVASLAIVRRQRFRLALAGSRPRR